MSLSTKHDSFPKIKCMYYFFLLQNQIRVIHEMKANSFLTLSRYSAMKNELIKEEKKVYNTSIWTKRKKKEVELFYSLKNSKPIHTGKKIIHH